MIISNTTLIELFGGIALFSAGFYLGVRYVTVLSKKQLDKYIDKIELKFINLLDNIDNIVFNKRINEYVYLSFLSFEIILSLDKKTISIFEKGECLATSTQISEDLKNDVFDIIEERFRENINDVTQIDNNIVSNNVIIQMKKSRKKNKFSDELLNRVTAENKKAFTVDGILDRISEIGFEKLSDEEKEFLKKH